jgi:hypothetical protein
MIPTIRMHPVPWSLSFQYAKKGDIFFVELDGLRWPLELRQKPPRVRLLEDGKRRPSPVVCEILDPWPNAPDYYPPEWKPGAGPAPVGSLYHRCPVPE